MTTTTRQPVDIHTYFGLSYSNYLVLHRSLLQSMPEQWQHQFTALMAEYESAFEHVEKADCYEVTAAVECEYGDLNDADMQALGITCPDAPDGGDEDADWEPRFYDKDGTEHESWESLLVPRPGGDPVPHYNRGRTRIEPNLTASSDEE